MAGENRRGDNDAVFREMLRAEDRQIRDLQRIVALAMQMLATQVRTKGEALAVIEGVREHALRLFPDKEEAFDLIYRPRLERIYRERFETDSGPDNRAT